MKSIFLFLFATFSIVRCTAQQVDVTQLIHVIADKEVAYPRLSNDGKKILYQLYL